MKAFMDQDFLLETETAKELFHDHAAKMPIIDYHCHINPAQIALNHQFKNITEAWLGGDHYKWRMIRSNGVPESLITGKESSDYEKFEQFAKTLPRAIGNPLYHWTHLELQRYFGITKTLSEKTCKEIWEECNAKLAQEDFRVQGIIKRSNVKLVATTDDPGDSLEWHQKIAQNPCSCEVVPAWRPDKAMKIENDGFKDYVEHIAKLTNRTIKTCEEFFAALDERMEFFNQMGCKASDHGVDYAYCRIVDQGVLEQIFQKGLNNECLTEDEIEAYKSMILIHLAKGYAKYGWVMQMHYGAIRDPNTKMFKILGADTGFDCVDNRACARGISALMNALNEADALPKMIWYSLNPSDNAAIATAIGSFQGPEAQGKIQQGSAWWFNDTYQGMVDQMTSLANLSVLGNFVGMLTDSRSFLSYTRHEYFRRIMCNLIGNLVEKGMYPKDMEFLGQIVEDISFNNTNRYFNFNVKQHAMSPEILSTPTITSTFSHTLKAKHTQDRQQPYLITCLVKSTYLQHLWAQPKKTSPKAYYHLTVVGFFHAHPTPAPNSTLKRPTSPAHSSSHSLRSSYHAAKTAQGILDARALYPDSSLADLYDDALMPIELRKAHQANDKAVLEAYGFPTKDFSESDIVAKLFEMYEALIKKEQDVAKEKPQKAKRTRKAKD